jgi:hypothetical protein
LFAASIISHLCTRRSHLFTSRGPGCSGRAIVIRAVLWNARAVPECAVPCRARMCHASVRAVPECAVPCRAKRCRVSPCRAVPCAAVPAGAVPCRAENMRADVPCRAMAFLICILIVDIGMYRYIGIPTRTERERERESPLFLSNNWEGYWTERLAPFGTVLDHSGSRIPGS